LQERTRCATAHGAAKRIGLDNPERLQLMRRGRTQVRSY